MPPFSFALFPCQFSCSSASIILFISQILPYCFLIQKIWFGHFYLFFSKYIPKSITFNKSLLLLLFCSMNCKVSELSHPSLQTQINFIPLGNCFIGDKQHSTNRHYFFLNKNHFEYYKHLSLIQNSLKQSVYS